MHACANSAHRIPPTERPDRRDDTEFAGSEQDLQAAPGLGYKLAHKSFAAFRGLCPAQGAFLALDDLVGGRSALPQWRQPLWQQGVWDEADAPRVLCPPAFRPFAATELGGDHALELAAQTLEAIHSAFFAELEAQGCLPTSTALRAAAGGGGASWQGGAASGRRDAEAATARLLQMVAAVNRGEVLAAPAAGRSPASEK